MLRFLKNLLELAGVVFLRFRPVPRIWAIWLVGVNAACLWFITAVEAQVVLAVTTVALAAMAIVYGRFGYVRILGTAHFLWIPMFVWMASRLDMIAENQNLALWLGILLATNAVSLVIDSLDAIRFLKGERTPFYRWRIA